MIGYVSCEGLESESDKGKKAAEEFCDCLDEGYTMSKCNENFMTTMANASLTNL
ncbi:MAG: hypothetical protein LBC19_01300 [Tannerella sp.]|nr:hypothetical protein [Tannerella sp.]